MDRISGIEWILGPFLGRQRAPSVATDLRETNGARGKLHLAWLTVAAIVVSLWRPLFAFLAAFYAGNWGTRILTIEASHVASGKMLIGLLIGTGYVLWICVTYLSIRFGVRDKVAQFAFLPACAASAIVCWFDPLVTLTCSLIVLAAFLLSFRERSRLRAAVAVLVAWAIGFCGFTGVLFLDGLFERYANKAPSCSTALPVWVYFLFLLLATWLTTFTCSAVHTWAVRPPDALAQDPSSIRGC